MNFSMLNFAWLLNFILNADIVVNVFNILNIKKFVPFFLIVESEFCSVCNASIETVRRDMEKRLTEDSSQSSIINY